MKKEFSLEISLDFELDDKGDTFTVILRIDLS